MEGRKNKKGSPVSLAAGSSTEGGSKIVPQFLTSLYELLEVSQLHSMSQNPQEHGDYIGWCEGGRQFVVKDAKQLSEYALAKLYRHKNYSTFIRQVRGLLIQ